MPEIHSRRPTSTRTRLAPAVALSLLAGALTTALTSGLSAQTGRGDGPCLAATNPPPDDIVMQFNPPGSTNDGPVMTWDPNLSSPTQSGSYQFNWLININWYCNGGPYNHAQTCILFYSVEIDDMTDRDHPVQWSYNCGQVGPLPCDASSVTQLNITVPTAGCLKMGTPYLLKVSAAGYNPFYPSMCATQIGGPGLMYDFPTPPTPGQHYP